MFEVNWLAVLVAGVINMAVGSVWYSPLMFLKPWMATLHKKPEMKEGNMGMMYIQMFVSALIMGYVMAMLTKLLHIMTIDMGIMLGFWVWLGFIATAGYNYVLFEQKPIKGYLINVGYYLVVLLLVGALMGIWQ
jgi:hypothetical protein